MAILNASATLFGAGSLAATFPEYRVSQLGVEAWVVPNPAYVISQLGIEAWVNVHSAIVASASFNGTGTFIADSFIPKYISVSFSGLGTLRANAVSIPNIQASFNGVGLLIVDATVLHQSLKDRKSTRLNSSHRSLSRMPSSA